MPIVEIKFSLPEEKPELQVALDGGKAHSALFAISQEVFRPARKHGYSDMEIQSLLDQLDNTEEYLGTRLIELLEKKFNSIIEEYELEIM